MRKECWLSLRLFFENGGNVKAVVKRVIQSLGYDVHRMPLAATPRALPDDFDESTAEIISKVRDFTMTSPERIAALCRSTEYVVRSGIPGDIVECGVWRGGSMMAVALTLLKLQATDRKLHLFDTFEGMSTPSDFDRDLRGNRAQSLLETPRDQKTRVWAYAPMDMVRENLRRTGYPIEETASLIKGKVEDTIPGAAPAQIALLRLDTDWYESTRHELEHLYPRLSAGGVLIIDDYGHWEGCRKAVDEYIARHKLKLLLNRIDYTCRIAVKCP